ncbi:DUF1624 domain-containing protein [Archangium lansingense]|uniref:Heparan-alpha-glucosaminide N-acetyltransferase domain-containing protein n=1 Tax=Archangium lansingense TaxID=2995310 RepID=A0ABT4A4L4_9BACT|nr:heparan-alpha-glucosaminide N-acetyltransferase domain-containing protein [Archangium lansinium]MCY1076585.1 heparan-alpha-glucosaminide N-acetyltransferase domain-containing protein [Archangium lansinium]
MPKGRGVPTGATAKRQVETVPGSGELPGMRVAVGRIATIDALRGFVMLLMLVDHAREFFYMHAQVSDPVDVATTPPGLFFTRLLAHLCAPVFVALTGLSAWLHGQRRGGRRATAEFLLKRGLFLVLLELTLVNFAWTFALVPSTYFLQVIWAIGLSMIALAGLLWLPRPALVVLGLAIVFGHNLLDSVRFEPGTPGATLWAILHKRDFIALPWGARARTSYPLLPWIGVIALGYGIGPWFAGQVNPTVRRLRLYALGLAALALFILLRLANGYGEPVPWTSGATPLLSLLSFLNLTKYPPSLDFLLLTMGGGALLLAALDHVPSRLLALLSTFGAAPLFFYLLHLYLLHGLNSVALALFGPNQGALFSVPSVPWLWALAALVSLPLWFACRWFMRLKARTRSPWLSYL